MNNISDKLVMTIILVTILFVFGLIFFIAYLSNPLKGLAFDTSDPSVVLLQNRISNNFSRKYDLK